MTKPDGCEYILRCIDRGICDDYDHNYCTPDNVEYCGKPCSIQHEHGKIDEDYGFCTYECFCDFHKSE